VHQLVVELQRIVASDLTHPALAAPLAAGVQGGTAYLVQEYVVADSVDMVIREFGAAPPVDALRVAAQLAGALDFAAAVHVHHGALHPRDVLLSSDDTRLTGVGIAHALEVIGVQAPVRRPYSPPERIAGGEWNRRADVFSLAMVTHELLWARRVSGLGARAVENLTEIEGGDLEALRAVFARALAEEPAARFATALEFAEALKLAFPGVIVSEEPSLVVSDEPVSYQPVGHEPAVIRLQSTPLPVTDHRRMATEAPQLPLLDSDEFEFPIGEIPVAEEERYPDVEAAPSLVRPDAPASAAESPTYLQYVLDEPERIDVGIREAPVSEPVGAPSAAASLGMPVAVREVPPAPRSTVERSAASRYPLIVALAVGLTMGFAAGYGMGTRQRAVPVAAAPPEATPAPAAREFTETAVASPPPPSAPAAALPNAEGPRPSSAVGSPKAEAGNPRAVAEGPKAGAESPQAVADGPKTGAESPKAVADGRLLLRSTPAGAFVFVDGRAYGPTPVAVRDLSPGAHRVRVVRNGFITADRQVVLTKARPSQSLTVDLERQASVAARGAPATTPSGRSGGFTGALMVVSRPPGAAIFMDGKLVGATPLSLPSVPAGTHAIRIEQEGYRRWTSAVRVVASEQNRITASLER
jgi:hypothetical protein